MSGYLQADEPYVLSGDNPPNNYDQFFPALGANLQSRRNTISFSAKMLMDFGNNQTQLLDAYGDYNMSDALQLPPIGKFKDPIGIERWQREQHVLFVERGMTTNLVPFRDNGIGIYGDLIPEALEYQLTFTNGAADLVNNTNGLDNDKTVTGRIFAHPFHGSDVALLKGLGVGVAGSYGTHSGSVANPDLTSGYVTPAQSKFFTYASSAYASGAQWRINPELTYYHGPLSLIAEYVLEEQGLRSGTLQRDLQTDAWMATATYVLTGEDARFDGVVPRNNLDPAHDHWGAFELVGRMSHLNVDNSAFPIFASPTASAHEATEGTVGGTWYMNPNFKINLDFTYATFEGGATVGDRPDEKAVLTRAQFKF